MTEKYFQLVIMSPTTTRDVFAGIGPDLEVQVEFGAFQKLGDSTTKKQAI